MALEAKWVTNSSSSLVKGTMAPSFPRALITWITPSTTLLWVLSGRVSIEVVLYSAIWSYFVS